jgi:imidazolonepropionase-like amidohydrolase
VKIAFGSDEYYDVPGMTRGEASLLALQAYREAGMPAIDVLRTATINAADLLGLGDRIGTLEAGRVADIVAVDGNPLDDVKLLRKTRFVMKAGQIIKR